MIEADDETQGRVRTVVEPDRSAASRYDPPSGLLARAFEVRIVPPVVERDRSAGDPGSWSEPRLVVETTG